MKLSSGESESVLQVNQVLQRTICVAAGKNTRIRGASYLDSAEAYIGWSPTTLPSKSMSLYYQNAAMKVVEHLQLVCGSYRLPDETAVLFTHLTSTASRHGSPKTIVRCYHHRPAFPPSPGDGCRTPPVPPKAPSPARTSSLSPAEQRQPLSASACRPAGSLEALPRFGTQNHYCPPG